MAQGTQPSMDQHLSLDGIPQPGFEQPVSFEGDSLHNPNLEQDRKQALQQAHRPEPDQPMAFGGQSQQGGALDERHNVAKEVQLASGPGIPSEVGPEVQGTSEMGHGGQVRGQVQSNGQFHSNGGRFVEEPEQGQAPGTGQGESDGSGRESLREAGNQGLLTGVAEQQPLSERLGKGLQVDEPDQGLRVCPGQGTEDPLGPGYEEEVISVGEPLPDAQDEKERRAQLEEKGREPALGFQSLAPLSSADAEAPRTGLGAFEGGGKEDAADGHREGKPEAGGCQGGKDEVVEGRAAAEERDPKAGSGGWFAGVGGSGASGDDGKDIVEGKVGKEGPEVRVGEDDFRGAYTAAAKGVGMAGAREGAAPESGLVVEEGKARAPTLGERLKEEVQAVKATIKNVFKKQ